MKSLTKAMVIGVLAIAFLSIFYYKNSSSALMRPYCNVSFSMENTDRYCYADDLEAECEDECWPGWPICHFAPWGNWGIRSNIQDKWDDDQFQGWKWTQFWHHWDWNSCTDSTHRFKPPTPCGDYYNYNATPWGWCWEQKQETSTGINTYGGGHRGIDIDREEWDKG